MKEQDGSFGGAAAQKTYPEAVIQTLCVGGTWEDIRISSPISFRAAVCPALGLIMPDIAVGAQIFDVVFHPTESLVYTGLLTGAVKAYSYDEQGQTEEKLNLRPSKRSCRGLAMSESGDRLWTVGKSKAL